MDRKVLSLDSENLYVQFKGEEHELSPLKLKHQALADKLSSEKPEEVMESIYLLLEESGMPRDVSEQIPINRAKDLIEALLDLSEKKS